MNENQWSQQTLKQSYTESILSIDHSQSETFWAIKRLLTIETFYEYFVTSQVGMFHDT